jgi:hypothetical protein
MREADCRLVAARVAIRGKDAPAAVRRVRVNVHTTWLAVLPRVTVPLDALAVSSSAAPMPLGIAAHAYDIRQHQFPAPTEATSIQKRDQPLMLERPVGGCVPDS